MPSNKGKQNATRMSFAIVTTFPTDLVNHSFQRLFIPEVNLH